MSVTHRCIVSQNGCFTKICGFVVKCEFLRKSLILNWKIGEQDMCKYFVKVGLLEDHNLEIIIPKTRCN